MKRSVRLIRHGESSANAGHASDDPHLIDLTDLGRQQALEIAASFQEQPDLIIHSPMHRAVMTAMPTMQRFPGVPVLEMDIQEFTYLDPLRCKGTTLCASVPLLCPADWCWLKTSIVDYSV